MNVFQKRIVRTNLDIHVFIIVVLSNFYKGFFFNTLGFKYNKNIPFS